MHPLVQKYLSDKKKEYLLRLGLYEKQYSPTDKYTDEYPGREFDEIESRKRYYKKVPIDVTDDEYALLLTYQGNNTNTEENILSIVYKGLAWAVFIGGFIAGIVFGNVDHSEFSFSIAIVWWLASFLSGLFILGFSEIIQLLNDIKNK